MRTYELVYIVHPDLDENAFNELVGRVQGWVVEAGGEVIKTDIWGKRRLAYPIRKQTEGQYVYLELKMSPEFCATLERNLRFVEPVMRFQVIVK